MSRRLARQVAAQVLYQMEMTGDQDRIEEKTAPWLEEFDVPQKHSGFAIALAQGVLEKREDLDGKIAATAREWALDRINVVDRNLLRLALYEMFYCPETPQKVAINEVVELAKRFGGEESAKFINGILDRLMDKEKGE